MDTLKLKNIVEAALLAAGGPLTVAQLQALFGDKDAPERSEIKEVLKALQEDYEGRGIEVIEVASGYRVQVREVMSQWLTKLWEERPPRYSRALMETLAIVAYRQPVTRGDVEEIRGVSVTTNIIRTLLERDWIKVVGHRDVPGKPAMFGTTREFLDYFSLKKLDDLPPLAELAKLEPMGVQLELNENPDKLSTEAAEAAEAGHQTEAAADSDEQPSDDGADGDGSPDEYGGETDREDNGEDNDESRAEADLDADLDNGEEGDFVAAADEDFDDEDEDVDPDEIAKALAVVDVIAAEMDGTADVDGDEEYDEDSDRPPGAAEPLVGLRKPGEGPPEPATVSSIAEARVAAAADQSVDPDSVDSESGDADATAEVVPLKTS